MTQQRYLLRWLPRIVQSWARPKAPKPHAASSMGQVEPVTAPMKEAATLTTTKRPATKYLIN